MSLVNQIMFTSRLLLTFYFLITILFYSCAHTNNESNMQAGVYEEHHILFIAGKASHGFGEHEHLAGSKLLAATIEEGNIGIRTTVISNWPEDDSIFDNVDSVVIYSDGGPGHPIMDHLESFEEVMDRGVGFVTLHYAVVVPPGEAGDLFLEWQGGYFETHWSVNPFWTTKITGYPDHPISNGVGEISIRDEWYFHMRFSENDGELTPILTDLPPEETLTTRDDGPYSNNPYVREAVLENKEEQHMAWAYERSNGGRSFGFTGGHYHWNWGVENFRRVVVNAIVWSAGVEVPPEGLQFSPIDVLELAEFIDDPNPEDWNPQPIQDMLDEANQY
ncbi:ThuA domain-containing protein [Fodinibius sediminis]|nr:ThuA domain-containing protein [Fodinibius sediminis]